MKTFITILLLILSISTYGQSELEITIFKYFNEYRVEHGLKPLKFDKKILLAASHHNNYLAANGFPGNYILDNCHRELELINGGYRLEKYGTSTHGGWGECIVAGSNGMFGTTDDSLKQAIWMWSISPPHKEMLLHDDMDIGAIGVLEYAPGKFIFTLNVVSYWD